ncbi:MAG: A/G-specific adenine glycosylase [Gammaproteobacteria bacterium]
MSGDDFAARLVAWQAVHGRHDLPWQRERTPYRVWLSEIMLQQTQVATVIPYFERVTARFPQVGALAAANLDEVLHLWSGLGYYSRARNLHASAKRIVTAHGGRFPRTQGALADLPGIGRSTAAAIVALAHDEPAAILDGNVKRVLARYHAEPGWPGESAVSARLWAHAEHHLPRTRVRDYTQALMDLGATVCTRARPGCARCPLRADCAAHAGGNPADYPGKRPPRTLPVRSTCFLIIENTGGEVLLERRPPSGVWGGLWCFPEAPDTAAIAARMHELGFAAHRELTRLAPLAHTFTHFRLDITPVVLHAEAVPRQVRERDGLRWYSMADSTRIGLSAPVARLLAARSPRTP